MTFLYYLALLLPLLTSSSPISPQTRALQSAGDISLPPNVVNIDNLFTINFEFEPAGFITMAIRFNIPGQFFAIGFGNRMPGSDIWIFELIGNEIVAGDYIATGYVPPSRDDTLGGTDNLENLGFEITPTYSLVKVRRALNTSDPNDAVIQQELTNIIYATGESPTVIYHGPTGRGLTVIPLIPGTFTSVGIEDSEESGTDKAHALVNVIAWGLLVDIAIIIVRFFRGTRLKIGRVVIPVQYLHAVLMTAIIIMSGTVTGLLLKKNRDARGLQLTHERDIDFHFINGLITLFLIIVTLFLGIVNLVIIRPYRKNPTSRIPFKALHRIFGLLLYLCAKANIITGALFYDEGSWRAYVYSYLFGLLLVHIGLEIFYLYKKYTPNKASPVVYKPSKSAAQVALLEAINKGTPREELVARFPKVKWVILGNRVYDLTHWIHPGGNFIIEACIGREVGRYFFGNYSLEGTKIEPHQHTALTISQMQKHCIGELTNIESLIVFKAGGTEAISWPSNHWKIASKTAITASVSEISFQCPEFQVKNFGKSISWLGRHYRLSKDSRTSAARLYTTAFSLNQMNFDLRQNIYRYFEDIMSDVPSPVFTYDNNYLLPQDVLPLYIKDYALFPGSFSHKVHSTEVSDPSNKFRIEGPLGKGFELTPNATGTHCIICAGTGVLPFIDFLNMFLWKTMYDLIKQKAGAEKAELINLLGIPFDSFFNGMNIVFIGAFVNEKEVLGLDIITKLAEISSKYNTNNFVAMIKGYSDTYITEVKESFNAEFLSKVITSQEEKFYVVGPPKMNETVPKSLRDLGVLKEKIMLV